MTAGRDLDRQSRPEVPPVPVAPGRLRDVATDVQSAAQAVQYLEAADIRADVAVTLQTAVVVTGSSPAETLQAAAAFVRESPAVEVHSIAWARVPGPVVDTVEFRATLLVSYPDGRGEFTGSTDHGPQH